MSSMAALLSGSAAGVAVARTGPGANVSASHRGQDKVWKNPSSVKLVARSRCQEGAPAQRRLYTPVLSCSSGTAFFQGEAGQLHGLAHAVMRVPLRRRRDGSIRAADDSDVPAFKGFPPMQTKPAFYWRMLAIIPYIMPLCEGWLYSETASNLHPFLDTYEILTRPFFQFLGRLPGWFLLAYFFAAYLGVVRNNRWPHFLRFHFITGMLLEIILQVIGTANDWIPPSLYWGKLGSHFWLAVSLAFVFIVIECILCALRGSYADVPFISDAAYMQIPYE